MKFKALQEKKQFIANRMVVGVDPAKARHQAAIVDHQGIQLGPSFSFPVSYEGFHHTLWEKIGRQVPACNPEALAFAVETSCNLWQTLAHYLHSCRYTVLLVSPLTTHHSRPFLNHDFSHTDPKDSLLVACNARSGYFDFYRDYSVEINARHDLSITYDKLRNNYVQQRTRLHAFLDYVFPEFPRVLTVGTKTARYLLKNYFLPEHFLSMDIDKEAELIAKISSHNHGIETLRKLQEAAKYSIGIPQDEIRCQAARLTLDSWLLLLDNVEQQMHGTINALIALVKDLPAFDILVSLKGISETLASLFLAETRDLSDYNHYKKLEKFAGLNIRYIHSGQYQGQGRISHIGNKRLSWIIYKMTEETSRYIPEVRIKYLTRQLKVQKYRKNIVASAPVLLKLIVSLVKDNRQYEFRPDKQAKLKTLERQYEALKAKRKKSKKSS